MVTTSIDELARIVDLPEPDVRGGLELLVHDGAATVWDADGDYGDPERVPVDMRIDIFVAYDPFDCAAGLD